MSYVRWGEGGSDLYIFMHVNGKLCCQNCGMSDHVDGEWPVSFYAESTDEFVHHLYEHQELGYWFPSSVIPDIVRDNDRNFPPEGEEDGDF